jgi:hypothetical protein
VTGENALLSVRVAPFVPFLPLLDSIPSKLRVKHVGIGRAHDFLQRLLSDLFENGQKDKDRSLLFMSVLAASGAGSVSDRSSTVTSVKPLRRR